MLLERVGNHENYGLVISEQHLFAQGTDGTICINLAAVCYGKVVPLGFAFVKEDTLGDMFRTHHSSHAKPQVR